MKSSNTPENNRRNFLSKGLLAFVGSLPLIGGLLGSKAYAAQAKKREPSATIPNMTFKGDDLTTGVYKGEPPMEPLDTMIRFERSDNNNDRAMTHEVLSLIHEEKGKNSYPWTIYSHLTTHHVEGDACVLCSRLTKNGPGWSSGLHSEVYNYDRAVCLGVNVETTNHYSGPEESKVIGVNIQTLGPQPTQYGIQVHGKQCNKGIGLNGDSGIGMDIGGKYETGIHAHGNSIRVSEGTCIELEDTGKIKVRYLNGRIEFLNGDKCVGHLNVNGEDHEL
ncbi:MAG: hypothetical protein ACYC27_21065 [Armatimonadota bacterium]